MTCKMDFDKAIELINQSTSVLLTCHQRPDGDAIGSMRAMCLALEHLGKKAQPLILTPLPRWYEYLFPYKIPLLGPENDVTLEQLTCGEFGHFDLIIILDTNSNNQLPVFCDYLKAVDTSVLVIDHHLTNDGLGDVELVDVEAPATGEIVYELIQHAKWPVDQNVAEAIFVAICTDTGWFKFPNTDSSVYRTAADLIDTGVEPCNTFRRMYQNFTRQRMNLMIRMLESMQLHFDDRVAIQLITRKDFDDTGTTGRDTENLIDECQRISTVEVAVLMVELKDNDYRCSLRSKGNVDVRKIAQKHGGGGHTQAAGVTLQGPVDKIKALLFDEFQQQLT